jgi:putative ABC transport system permease protein
MFKLAFRNIFRNRLRTALTLAAIVCGVAAIIVSGGFVEDVFVQLRESTIHSRLGHAQIFRKGYLDYGRRDPTRYLIEQPQPLIDQVRSIPHVQAVMTRVSFSGLANNGRADLPIIGEGVEADKEARLGTAMRFIAGHTLRDDQPFGVIVGEGVATALRLKPGSPLNLTVSTPQGAMNTLEFTVVGVFRSFSKDYDDRAVRIAQAAALELLYTPAIHSVVVLLDDTARTDATVARLREKLDKQGYEVKSWQELADFYNKTVALYKRQFGALQFIILVMLVLSVASTVNMVVYERTGEFGTLLALGLKRRQIFWLVLLENTLLGLVGGVLGVVFGLALAAAISGIGLPMPPPPGSNAAYTASIRIVPWVLAMAALTGAAAATLAALLPGRRASRLAVVDALRHNI